ncbi:MAG: ABC transporter ATP-binding protein [Salibaculum sp.]|jgi:subfamily B ATP-binding cassette protein MsbA|uniref:ABC transporter ATP-binding protein n=1 Tax=Roseovarius halophilus (ex Wu et al. 2025) TaxID=3376060 RepID=UPI00286FD2D9|nr:ABC transporter ATP-binding protein [Salibaculum sp.]MDR9427767.1 ABC transporter ATP-binding protein [Salibaculum sp.]MDR9482557.1 ABC transporter ATP-binding protein [Salibaculum sp.]
MSTRRHSMGRWLWQGYLREHLPIISIALVIMMIEGATLGVMSYMTKPMFDNVFIGGDMGALWVVGLIILGVFFARAVTSVTHRVLLKRISELSAARMRTDLMAHLVALDMSFHQAYSPGTLIERVQGDVQALGQVWTGIITGLGRDVVSVFWLFGVALYIDWKWTLVALVGIPLLVAPSLMAQRYVRGKARTAREVSASMSTRLDEVFHGIMPIKLNSLERYQQGRYNRLNDDRVTSETQAALGQALIPGLIDIMTGIGFFCVLFFAGSEIVEGDKSVGDFMAFFTAMALAFDPLRRLGNLSGLWQAASAAVERIRELFDIRPTLVSPAAPASPPPAAPEIRFEEVHLAYGDLPVLTGASFTAEAGKTTALVGASGAGKSTVFNVLTRLVDPGQGRVTLDETPVNAMAVEELRSLVSTVAQDAALFDESLRDNILLGREDVDAAHLQHVLDAAHVSDFLPKLSDGLDTPVGPRGSNLSGGQRQRVAIARALLRDTPILLLDEATSALDTKSEAVVQAALDRLAEGRTTLVIAHRLSTVRNAKKILVMDKGRVVDEGTHDALLARGGHYADLYRLQFKEGRQVVDAAAPRLRARQAKAPARAARGLMARLFGGSNPS